MKILNTGRIIVSIATVVFLVCLTDVAMAQEVPYVEPIQDMGPEYGNGPEDLPNPQAEVDRLNEQYQLLEKPISYYSAEKYPDNAAPHDDGILDAVNPNPEIPEETPAYNEPGDYTQIVLYIPEQYDEGTPTKIPDELYERILGDIARIMREGWADEISEEDFYHCHILIPRNEPGPLILYHTHEYEPYTENRNIVSHPGGIPYVVDYLDGTPDSAFNTVYPHDLGASQDYTIYFYLEESTFRLGF